MDLKRLTHLVALADTRNFSRAAERVHLTQPAFSRSVQAAESELGLQLFERGTREVNCTVAGAFVIERARKLLFEKRCLERDVSLYRERKSGDLAFGVGPYPAVALLPALMIDLRKRYAGVSSRIEVNNWQTLLAHLRAEELEFFISDVRDVPKDPALAMTTIGRLRGSFYVRAGHPLLGKKSPTPADLMGCGIATVKLPVEIRAVLKELLLPGGDGPLPIAVECDDVHLLRHIALSTDTVLATTEAGVAKEVREGALHEVALRDFPTLSSHVGIVSLQGRTFSPMADYAVKFLTRSIGKQKPAKAKR